MKYPKELKTALSGAESVLAQRQRVRDAIRQADDDRRALTGRLADVQQRLASEEADAALSAEGYKPGPARRELATVREDEQAIEARVVGLQAKLADSDEDILKARANLRDVANEYIREQVAEIDEWWEKAVTALFAEARPRVARRLALVGKRPHALRDLKFPALNAVDSLPCRLAPEKREDGHSVDAMLDDSNCRKAYDEAAELGKVAAALEKEADQVRKAREQFEAEAAAADSKQSRSFNAPYVPPGPAEVPERERGGVARYEQGRPLGLDSGAFGEVIELHEQGKSLDEILASPSSSGKPFGKLYFRRTIESWVHSYETRKAEALSMQAAGKSVEEIADALQWPRLQVERWLQRKAATATA